MYTEAQGLVEVDLSPILDLFVIVHCCRPLYVVSLGYVTLLKVVPSPLPSWFRCVHWVNTHHEVNPVFGNNTLKNSSGCPLVPCHPFSLTSLPTCALSEMSQGGPLSITGYIFLHCNVCFLRSPAWTSREGTGTPLPYSCLENPMDGGAW